MSTHATVLKLLVSLGYTNTKGCCHGVSLRWLEACLIGEEHLFAKRINTIVSGGEGLANSIHAVKEKKGRNLTKKDRMLLDVLAFYESLEIYHSPEEHFSLFNAPLAQPDIEAVSYYASSDAIKSLGGLVRVYSEPGIYTKEEIKEYLNNLGVIIESTCATSKDPLGIVLSSDNHTVALIYKPGAGWRFMDINQYPSQAFKIDETDLLAQRIVAGFKESSSPYSAFNTSVFTTANHLQLINLKEKFDQFVTSHQLTKKITARVANEINLAYIAAQHGHLSVISELAKYGTDLNKANNNGTTTSFMAAQNGYAPIIAELAKHGADLNKARKDGVTPAIMAANNGHAQVITELAKYGVDLNKVDNDGQTPAFRAAQNGHAPVIAELAKHGSDLNKARKDGITPALMAANNGHAPVIAELAKHDADLNKVDNDGQTPALLAAHNGHVSVITELAKHGADLNKASNKGATPAFIAANNGHAPVITELAKYGVNLNEADENGTTSALLAARNGHVLVITELAKHGADLNKASNEGVTPAFFAAQNGHAPVIAELKRLGADFNIPYTSTVDKLRQFASSKGKSVIARMEQFINQQLFIDPERQTISMTPDQIAFVMGHGGIMQLQKKDAEEHDFNQAVAQISRDKNNVDLTIKPYLGHLITQVNTLKKEGKESTADLTQVLVATHERLHNKLDVASYKDLAEKVQGKPSAGMKILGGIMIGLGATIVALGVITTAFWGPLNTLIIGAGALTTVAGFGFFKAGTQKGLSKIMDDISEQQSLSTNANSFNA